MADIQDGILEQLYVRESLPHREIARRLGVTQHFVLWSLGAAGIPLRDKSTAAKGKPKSPEHRRKLAENLAKARAAQTEEANLKRSAAMKGREPPNKGKTWTDETRAQHEYRQTEEYRRAASERQKGEKSHLWRGGQTPAETLRMQGWEWRQRRKECYARDLWTCQDCGVHCGSAKGSTKIQAHHLIARRDGGTDDLENLVTLCMSCHHLREWLIRHP